MAIECHASTRPCSCASPARPRPASCGSRSRPCRCRCGAGSATRYRGGRHAPPPARAARRSARRAAARARRCARRRRARSRSRAGARRRRGGARRVLRAGTRRASLAGSWRSPTYARRRGRGRAAAAAPSAWRGDSGAPSAVGRPEPLGGTRRPDGAVSPAGVRRHLRPVGWPRARPLPAYHHVLRRRHAAQPQPGARPATQQRAVHVVELVRVDGGRDLLEARSMGGRGEVKARSRGDRREMQGGCACSSSARTWRSAAATRRSSLDSRHHARASMRPGARSSAGSSGVSVCWMAYGTWRGAEPGVQGRGLRASG